MKTKLKIQRLKEAWKNPTTNGIFHNLQTLDVPWQELNIDPSLDIQYHFNRSGEKIVAPLISSFTDNDEELKNADIATITNVVYNMFSNKWTKLYELLSLEFDPIENYSMTEQEIVDRDTTDRTTHTGTQGTTHTGTQADAQTGTQTITHTGTQTDVNTGTQTDAQTGTQTNAQSGGTSTSSSGSGTSSGSGSNDSSIYGFNSSTAVGERENESTTSATTSTTNSETFTTTRSDTRTDNLTNTRTDNLTDTRTDNLTDERTDHLTNTRTDNLTDTRTDNLTDAGTGTEDITRTLTRSGNIGVTTSQQMISSSIELWQWIFFDTVFRDIDSILTIQTY